ncbi:MAG: hypothetical protein V4649_08240 [Bacteroidota bacterium]
MLPKQLLLHLILILSSTAVMGQRSNFPGSKFDSVLMYDFKGEKGNGLYIVNNGKLAGSIEKTAKLTASEARTLTSKIALTQSYGGSTASCFDPHLGFVYLFKGKIVAHVTVCLDCNRLRSNPAISQQQQGKVGTGDNAYYISDGMSKTFRRYLNQLLIKNNFSHQIPHGSSFDS